MHLRVPELHLNGILFSLGIGANGIPGIEALVASLVEGFQVTLASCRQVAQIVKVLEKIQMHFAMNIRSFPHNI